MYTSIFLAFLILFKEQILDLICFAKCIVVSELNLIEFICPPGVFILLLEEPLEETTVLLYN